MNSEKNRLETFKDWNVLYIEKNALALLGFYFLTQPDTVKCNFCGVEIREWKTGDDVLSEHRKWSPSCKLINRFPTKNIPIDQNKLNEILPPAPLNDVYSRLERNTTVSEGCIEFVDINLSTDNEHNCKVCISKKVNCAIIVCGHLTCSDCIVKLNKCPICRSEFNQDDVLKIFFA